MKTLLVDIGNSAIKVGPEQGSIGETAAAAPAWTFEMTELVSDPFGTEPAHWYCGSVNTPALDRLAAWLGRYRPGDQLQVLRNDDFAVPLRVDFPERVGIDRVAAAAAAVHLKRPESAAIVIDIGTATTVDAVTPAGEFLGGAILASPSLMLRALNLNTQALPAVQWEESPTPPEPIGRNTQAALQSGAFWGQLGAIQELARRYQRIMAAPCQIFLSGRGSQAIAPLLDPPGTCFPGLVLAGIATTLDDCP